MKKSRRNRDLSQSRKSVNFSVLEMDQNRVENIKIYGLYPMIKISVSMDISVLGFYGYIGDISVDIFFFNIDKSEIIQN